MCFPNETLLDAESETHDNLQNIQAKQKTLCKQMYAGIAY